MPMTFPDSPTVGQKNYPSTGYKVWQYDGSIWNSYDYSPLFKNIVVNGNMRISQENGNNSTALATSGQWWSADQWVGGWSTPSATVTSHSYSPSIFEGGGGPHPGSAIVMFSSSFLAAPVTTQHAHIYQRIEGRRSAILGWGTPLAKPAVLRFMAMVATPGVYSIKVGNGDHTRSWVGTFTATGTNVWQEFVVPIPPDTTGVYYTDWRAGLFISFGCYWGSTYVGVAGWQNGDFYATAATNMWTNSGYFRIARVGLYVDPFGTGVAPVWVEPQYAQDEIECMRYWYKGYCIRGVWSSNNLDRAAVAHPVNMRVPPGHGIRGSIPTYSGAAGGTVTGIGVNYSDEDWMEMTCSSSGAFTNGHVACSYISNPDVNYFTVNSRM